MDCCGHSIVVVEGFEPEGRDRGKAFVFAAHATNSGGEWHISTYGTRRGMEYATSHGVELDTVAFLFNDDGTLSDKGRGKFISPGGNVKFAGSWDISSANGKKITGFLYEELRKSMKDDDYGKDFHVLGGGWYGKINCIAFAKKALAKGGICFSPKEFFGVPSPARSIDERLTRDISLVRGR
jgi:hypothetical protein